MTNKVMTAKTILNNFIPPFKIELLNRIPKPIICNIKRLTREEELSNMC